MIEETTKRALDLYALCGISKEDVEYLLKRKFSDLTQEELDYIQNVIDDYNSYVESMQYHHMMGEPTIDLTQTTIITTVKTQVIK